MKNPVKKVTREETKHQYNQAKHFVFHCVSAKRALLKKKPEKQTEGKKEIKKLEKNKKTKSKTVTEIVDMR